MPLPTLYTKGVLNSYHKSVKKEKLDEYYAIHFLMELLNYKRTKAKVNIHDRLLMLKSETGTGKSTAFVVECFRRFLGKYDRFPAQQQDQVNSYKTKLDFDFSVFDYPDDEYTIANRSKNLMPISKKQHLIYCTQPTTLTAKSKSEEIATEVYNPDLELGTNVGYSTGSFKCRITEQSGVMYATLGSFTTLMKKQKNVDIIAAYDFIMIDECHIQSVELEVGMALVRTFLRDTAGIVEAPIFIFMSATFNIKEYAEYMGTPESNSIFVKGGVSKYDVIYSDKPSNNYIEDAAALAYKIHKDNPNDTDDECDILVFAPSPGECKKIASTLRALDIAKELIIYQLSGEIVNLGGTEVAKIEYLPLAEVRIMEENLTAKRRVTMTTNVAETGITIRALKYVIDCGFDKTSAYSAAYGMNILVTKNVVRSSTEQRAGRVGRNFFGYAYRMYTKETYDKLPEYSFPNTYSQDMSKDLLDVMYARVSSEYINDLLAYEQFASFKECCVDPQKLRLSADNSMCRNIYANTIISDSQTHSIDKYYTDASGSVPFVDNPPELLHPLPQDNFVAARAKLISLGLYGTFAGYLVSKMSRVTVEAARMMVVCSSYGVSLNDAATLAIVGMSQGNYKIDQFTAKRMNLKGFYSRLNIAKKVVSESNIKRYFFGDIRRFLDIVCDDFIEAMMIFKFLIKMVKNSKGDKFNDLRKSFEINGLKFYEFQHMLVNRLNLIQDCTSMGLANKHPDLDFSSPDIMNHIARIKRLLWAGYKNNHAFHKERNKYVTSAGVEVIANIVTKEKPKKIIYSALHMKENANDLMYNVGVVALSAMDGWI
jgi:HrpA-like RNA helicase